MALKREKDVDYAKSTHDYPMPEAPVTDRTVPLPAEYDDVSFTASTDAYPMAETTVLTSSDTRVVDANGHAINFAASTGAYPMVQTPAETVQEHIGAKVEAIVPTPGPVSTGLEPVVAAQRADLGLSADPTGESDAGYEPRPSTVPAPGADGVDRKTVSDQAEGKAVQAPEPTPAARRQTRATGK